MSSSNEYRKHEMPSHLRLGPDRDGHVDTEKWKRDLDNSAASFFDDLTECFRDGEKRDWMNKHATFQFTKRTTNSNGISVVNKKPFPKAEDEDYDEACEERRVWRAKKERFHQKAPAIISFMLEGTMCKDSRDRLLRVIDSGNSTKLRDIKQENDILALRSEMISIHDYSGLKVQRKDRDAAFKLMADLKVSKFKTGDRIAGHKLVYNEILRKLTSFKLIGNADPIADSFNREYLYEAFFDPMYGNP